MHFHYVVLTCFDFCDTLFRKELIYLPNTANLNIRVDAQLKHSADALFAQLGLNTSTAVNIFLRRCVSCGGIPFELRVDPAAQAAPVCECDYMSKLENFLDNKGRLIALPVKRKMKLYALLFFADKFTPGEQYSEAEVNDTVCRYSTFNDPATIRRELCGYGFFDRTADCSVYTALTNPPTPAQLGLEEA